MKKITKILSVGALALMLSSGYAQAEVYTVFMKSDKEGKSYFEPSNLTIQKDDTVVWIQADDMVGHNAVAPSEMIPKGAEGFETPMMEEEGQTWSRRFDKEGTYNYHCHPHAALGMMGKIIVGRESTDKEKAMPMEGGDGHGMHSH